MRLVEGQAAICHILKAAFTRLLDSAQHQVHLSSLLLDMEVSESFRMANVKAIVRLAITAIHPKASSK